MASEAFPSGAASIRIECRNGHLWLFKDYDNGMQGYDISVARAAWAMSSCPNCGSHLSRQSSWVRGRRR